MSNRKHIFIFIFTTSLLVGFLPVTNYIDNSNKTSLKEIFSTDIIESNINYYFYKWFDRSLVNKQMVAGKNNFLFLGNQNNYIVSKTQNIYPYHKKGVENWVDNLSNLQTWYEEQNIKFIMTIVPNKHSIYGDKLPNWIVPEKNNITDKLLKLSKKNNLNLLDLRPVFLTKRKTQEEQLYLKTDSHWNSYGASIGYDETVKKLNSIYNKNYITADYNLKYKKTGAKGLSRFLKATHLFSKELEKVGYFRFEKNHNICSGDIDKDTNKLSLCKIKEKNYFDIHKGPQYINNIQATNKEKLLFLCDSFSMQNIQLYDRTFTTIWKYHFNKIFGKKLSGFIKKHQPDIVIYQIAERSLYNNYFLGKQM